MQQKTRTSTFSKGVAENREDISKSMFAFSNAFGNYPGTFLSPVDEQEGEFMVNTN